MGEEDPKENSKDLDLWMIRPCEIYDSEYSECTSIMSRLHQMFIFGNTIDCNSRHEDYSNCVKWKKQKNIKAAEALINSEKNKRLARLKTFYENNVWENRKSPPENWNDPLPDYIAQRRQNSTLQDAIDKHNQESNSNSFCTIM